MSSSRHGSEPRLRPGVRAFPNLPYLRWVAILLPAVLVVATELGLHPLLEPILPAASARLLTATVLVLGVIACGLTIFRLLDEKERTILAQARQARTLYEIGAETSALLQTDRLIAVVVDRARELLDADVAGLARMNADGGTLYWHHFVGADAGGTGLREIRLRRGEGLVGYVAASGRPLAIADTALGLPTGLASAPILELEGLRSALAVPLRGGERSLGTLMVANRTPTVFAGDQVTLLTSFANQVAIALDNAELYASAQLAAQRFEWLIESSGDAIITLDLDGRILSWNRGAEEIYGWSREEAVGAVLPMVPPHLVEDARNRMADVLAHGATLANYETERQRKDGRRIPVVVTVSPIRNAAGEIAGLLGISKDMSTHRQLEQQERRWALFEDRERIGMELHDGAIQSLYAVGLGLGAVAQVLDRDPSLARMRLTQACDSVNGVIQEIRNYIFGLRPDAFERHGLVSGLASLAEALKVNSLIELELDLAHDARHAFSAEQAAELFQIAREALANVGRHAGASRVMLSLRRADESWLLRVWDNGVGFEPTAVAAAGFGLGNMRERARRLGGALSITSRLGNGTEVRLELPGTVGSVA